jgi:hypothetical protein
MTTLGERPAAPLRDEHPDTRALIKEARRLRRRRYLLVTVALVTVTGAIATALAVSHGNNHGRSGGSHPPNTHTAPQAAPPVASTAKLPGVALPSSGYFNQISATPSGLVLSGVTPASAGSPLPVCVSAPVDPQSLVVGKVTTGNCGDPRLFGQSVEAVNTPVLRSNNATTSVNSVNPASGQVMYGPVVMSYSSYSDTRPVTASGGQWLWIYDVDTTKGPVLLQISDQSGAVADTIPMPSLYKPLLAADNGGVWVANSVEGDGAPALFYVPAGSSAPRVVVTSTNVPICWIVASGTSAWVGSGVQACAKQDVQRFVDGSEAPVFTTSSPYPLFTVIGSEPDGLWTMQYLSPSTEAIVRIDPDTGSESVVATVPAVPLPSYLTSGGLVQGQGAYDDGHLYLLEPPFHKSGYLGYTSIVSIDAPPGD